MQCNSRRQDSGATRITRLSTLGNTPLNPSRLGCLPKAPIVPGPKGLQAIRSRTPAGIERSPAPKRRTAYFKLRFHRAAI
jgi:hypothetical protein